MAILIPKKVPHRKVRKGKNAGIATRCNTVAFGDFGLMSLDNERITSRQIEAARQANFSTYASFKEAFGCKNGFR